ncbi:hypothetical protein SprV_0200711200 [Sparganum proliferum]
MLETCVDDKQSVSISEVQLSRAIFTSETKPQSGQEDNFVESPGPDRLFQSPETVSRSRRESLSANACSCDDYTSNELADDGISS